MLCVTSSPTLPSPRVARNLERAFPIRQADREPIELRLTGVADLALGLEALAHACGRRPRHPLAKTHCRAKASASDAAPPKTRQPAPRPPAGSAIPGRRVQGCSFSSSRNSTNKPVVVGVRDSGLVEHVIAVVVPIDLGSQLRDTLLHAGGHRLHQLRRSRRLRCSKCTSSSRRLRMRCDSECAALLVLELAFQPVGKVPRPTASTRSKVAGASRGPGTMPNSEIPGNIWPSIHARGRTIPAPSCWRHRSSDLAVFALAMKYRVTAKAAMPSASSAVTQFGAFPALDRAQPGASATIRCLDASAVRVRSDPSAGGGSTGSAIRLAAPPRRVREAACESTERDGRSSG